MSEKLSILKNLHLILEFITTFITRKMHEFSEDFLEFVHSFINSFSKYLLHTFYVIDHVWSTADKVVN